MKILKASAGSGKTYTLSHTYIDYLLSSDDPFAYRHILAVTFTNKATGEMKKRILEDLFDIAGDSDDPRHEKAARFLSDILHDYGAFAISTIDKFFQQTLKAFSREIGYFASYQIELDRGSLIEEASDRILDSLSESDRGTIDWIKQSAMEKIEQGSFFKLEEGLCEIGARLKSDEFRELAEELHIDPEKDFSKERLTEIRKSCRQTISAFERSAKDFGLVVESGHKVKAPGVKMRKSNPELATFYDDNIAAFTTAVTIDKAIFSLGLAGIFHKEFEALVKEKNIMSIDDSNTILKGIIDGSDAPFIYEKLGVRYEDFLLDEFQDTSAIQWENFRPLLEESESKGGKNLVVGDVKQSIYRFRGSDWTLLGEKIGSQFPRAESASLDCNWRSTRTVVNFNSEFFKYAAEQTGLEKIYADVLQKPKADDAQAGLVRATFTDDQPAAILESVRNALDNGARQGDIAVLVRNNADGAEIASLLIGEGYNVVSDDSLSFGRSSVIRRLVSLLGIMDNPEDEIAKFTASTLGITLPKEYHSIPDLCESLLREIRTLDQASFEGETLFIQSFMDILQNWIDINGGNIHEFVKYWKEKGSNLYISSPEVSDSIRIMTIHKSKGLEFPHVIFPYAEKVKTLRPDTHWCEYEGSVYPVTLSSSLEGTVFEDRYLEDKLKQSVDNLNVFYVALTRAVCSLHVIAKTPSAACRKSIGEAKVHFGPVSELLFAFSGGADDRTWGEQYDFTKMERKEKSRGTDFPASYPSFPYGNRLNASDDAFDYFGEDGHSTGNSARAKGIVLHGILSGVNVPEDLPGCVEEAVLSGQLPAEEAAGVLEMLTSRIASHSDWFRGEVLNETAIIDPVSGEERRPDRVVRGTDGSIVIVDYKFGRHNDKHNKQVREYVNLYKMMGFGNVSGYVWYVRENEVV